MLKSLLGACVGFTAALIAAPLSHATVLAGQAVATDGDSLVLGDARVRLFGVDALEAEQTCRQGPRTVPCGGAATRALSAKIAGQTVICVQRDEDAYGRIVAKCRVGETDLGAWLVRRGHALAFTRFSSEYAADEAVARAAGAGVWAAGLAFETPWDWRASQRGGAATAARTAPAPTAACDIKGNVNAAGERIYHTRASRMWGRTQAEAMFCSVAEAEAAGFRAPRG